MLDSYAVVAVDWRNSNQLRLKTRGIYRFHPQRLYRVHRPAAVIVTLLLASGDIESNPGPVQYPCTVCKKPVKRNQRGIMCDGCSQWTHARCGGVEVAEYLLLTAQESCEWFCPSCVRSKLSIASLSLLGINNSSILLHSKVDEVSSALNDTELSGVDKTSLQHSESHSEDGAKKRSAKDRKYYEKHKARILANRKQKYKENAEVEKAASRLRYYTDPQPQKTAARAWSKAKYSANPEPQKTAARTWSKAKYSANPEPQKTAARTWSKAKYSANPEPQKTAARAWSKAKYSANPEPQKTAARTWSKAKYSANPEPQKTAARAWSKAKYSANPEPQKTAARAWSKAKYSANLYLI